MRVEKRPIEAPKVRRCSSFSFNCLLAAQVFIPIFSIAFVIFGIFDLIGGNLAHILIQPLFILFSSVQFILIGLAIDYAEGRKFPDPKDNS